MDDEKKMFCNRRVTHHWVEFSGNPEDDKENYKRYTSGTAFKGILHSDEVVHFVDAESVRRFINSVRAVAVKNENRQWFEETVDKLFAGATCEATKENQNTIT